MKSRLDVRFAYVLHEDAAAVEILDLQVVHQPGLVGWIRPYLTGLIREGVDLPVVGEDRRALEPLRLPDLGYDLFSIRSLLLLSVVAVGIRVVIWNEVVLALSEGAADPGYLVVLSSRLKGQKKLFII